jgi:hypothetical protein
VTVPTIPQRYDPAVPVARLSVHPANPRRGARGAIAESMEVHGFYGAVYAQESTGRIISGNNRYAVAVDHGARDLPVIWLDVDDDQALRLLLVLNRTEDEATNDDRDLLAVLGELGQLDGTGYDLGDLGDLQELLDADAWGDPAPNAGAGAGSGAGDPGPGDDDDGQAVAMPRIDLAVTSAVFEGWTRLLARYTGADDVAKLRAHLERTGHLT